MRNPEVPPVVYAEISAALGSDEAATALVDEVRRSGHLAVYVSTGAIVRLAKARAIVAAWRKGRAVA